MISIIAAFSAALLLPAAVLGQNDTAVTVNSTVSGSATSTTSESGTGAANGFVTPTVTGTSCGGAQQNFNQCVTKVGKDISSCPATAYVCLCQTYANLAECYDACPDLPDGETWKGQAQQFCSQANISDTGSVYNTTSPTVNASGTTTTSATPGSVTPTGSSPSGHNTTSTGTSPATTASSFARSAATRNIDLSLIMVGIATGLCAFMIN